MPCKPGVAGSIPGFSIKPLSVEPSGVPVILINTQIINPPGPVLVSTHGKATKSFMGSYKGYWTTRRYNILVIYLQSEELTETCLPSFVVYFTIVFSGGDLRSGSFQLTVLKAI